MKGYLKKASIIFLCLAMFVTAVSCSGTNGSSQSSESTGASQGDQGQGEDIAAAPKVTVFVNKQPAEGVPKHAVKGNQREKKE